MRNTIWEISKVVIPSLFVLLGPLLGIIITNKGNRERTDYEYAHKEKVERVNVLREKMEELYLLHSRWAFLLRDFQWAHVEYFSGKYTNEELNEKILKDMDERRTLYGKIDMIINLYFVDLREQWNSIRKQCDDMMEYMKKPFIPKHLDKELKENYTKDLNAVEKENKEILIELSEFGKKNGLTTVST